MLALPSIRFLSNKQCVKSGKRDLVKFNDPFLVLVQVALLIVFVSIKWTVRPQKILLYCIPQSSED